jgi:mRNA interferase MazF
VVTPQQGEIWWAEGREKRRPVLVVTRSDVIPRLARIVVAPVTTRVRGLPTEIAFDETDGLREPCAASFDNLDAIPTASLTTRIGETSLPRRADICRALAALADCA